jgi:hypothetical protein
MLRRRVGHFNLGSVTRVCLIALTEITGGAPLLALFEKWPAGQPILESPRSHAAGGRIFILRTSHSLTRTGPEGWPTLSLISTPEGAPSLCLRSLQTQGGDFDLVHHRPNAGCLRSRSFPDLGFHGRVNLGVLV